MTEYDVELAAHCIASIEAESPEEAIERASEELDESDLELSYGFAVDPETGESAEWNL